MLSVNQTISIGHEESRLVGILVQRGKMSWVISLPPSLPSFPPFSLSFPFFCMPICTCLWVHAHICEVCIVVCAYGNLGTGLGILPQVPSIFVCLSVCGLYMLVCMCVHTCVLPHLVFPYICSRGGTKFLLSIPPVASPRG